MAEDLPVPNLDPRKAVEAHTCGKQPHVTIRSVGWLVTKDGEDLMTKLAGAQKSEIWGWY